MNKPIQDGKNLKQTKGFVNTDFSDDSEFPARSVASTDLLAISSVFLVQAFARTCPFSAYQKDSGTNRKDENLLCIPSKAPER